LDVIMTPDPIPTATLPHRSLARLNEALADVRAAPRDQGVLHLIVRRPAVGLREVLENGELTPDTGLVGDTWHARHNTRADDGLPHPDTQITLMSVRAIGAISPDEARWSLAGDQLFVDLDLTAANLPPGTRLQIGGAELEVTAQPHTGCGKFVERFGVDAMKWVNAPDGRALNLRGIYAKVVQGGHVRQGDPIIVRR
jgi:MOSC domain-containing protein YiiM